MAQLVQMHNHHVLVIHLDHPILQVINKITVVQSLHLQRVIVLGILHQLIVWLELLVLNG
jgi:hypothetical protein